MSTRIDIVINERGSETVTSAIDRVASELHKLSPKAARSLRGKALRVGVNTDKLTKDVAVAALGTVVYRTPHDTGQARANWQVSIGAKPNVATPLEETDYDGDRTVAIGALKILTSKRKPGQSIYISNVLPYIQRLNEGWSKQAPAGFVELAVQTASAVARTGRERIAGK